MKKGTGTQTGSADIAGVPVYFGFNQNNMTFNVFIHFVCAHLG
jgi:hypothetical protein